MSQSDHIVIRPLTSADREGWETLWRDYLDFYQSRLDPSQFDFTFQRLSDPNYAGMFGFLAEYQGKLVGLVEAVYAYADENGKANVYWMTQTTNHTARKLYDRVGQPTNFMKYIR